MSAQFTGGETGEADMSKAIHSMIIVLDETRSVAFYEKAFDLRVVDRLEFDSFVPVYLCNPESDFEIDLTVNKGQTAAYDVGNGYGHLAVSVSDAMAEHARFVKAGLAPRDMVDFAPGGTLIARFFFVADPDGYQIEVLQRAGRYR